MAKMRKVPVNGVERDAVEVGFTVKREEWNEYELADGGIVRFKAGILRILQVLDADGKPARTPDGTEPLLVVQSANSLVITE